LLFDLIDARHTNNGAIFGTTSPALPSIRCDRQSGSRQPCAKPFPDSCQSFQALSGEDKTDVVGCHMLPTLCHRCRCNASVLEQSLRKPGRFQAEGAAFTRSDHPPSGVTSGSPSNSRRIRSRRASQSATAAATPSPAAVAG
jgi:hypothetical protein